MSKFNAKNSLRKQAKTRPSVGIFWIEDDGSIIPFPEEVSEITPVENFVDSSEDHYRAWSKVKKSFPKYRNVEYEEVPRGRVVYNTATNKFTIFLGSEYMNNSPVIDAITRAFSIPKSQAEVWQDPHYEMENPFSAEFEDSWDEDDYDNF